MAIRVDADQRIGTGHAMRCLALAEGWRDRGGAVRCLSRALPHGLKDRYLAEGIELVEDVPPLHDPTATAHCLARERADWVVIDGEAIPAELLAELQRRRQRTLVVDDWGSLPRYDCDLVLNQNWHADAALYRAKTGARLLLGPAYALLRREIRAARMAREERGRATRLLLTFGGSDPEGVSLRMVAVAERFRASGGASARLVVGAANPRLAQIRAAATTAGVDVLADVRSMAEQYAWCDLAVTASGGTAWELAFLGVPMIVGAAVESELRTGQSIAAAGAGIYVGRYADVEPQLVAEQVETLAAWPEVRRRLAATARGMIDGKGVERILEATGVALRRGATPR
jgi:UDP-2,4-diacetamido-2,4,6-trideoxy-beta-L-altropyranose hydrolase